MTRSCAKSWCAYGEWGEAHMGSAYDFNLLMYFVALRIGTRCLPGYHGPFVSPLSPLLALCLLFCLLLLLPAAAAWLGFLFCSTAECSWVLLFWKECESVWLLKSMSGDLGGQSPKIWFRTSFGPRLHLVRTSFKLQPVKTQPGEVLERLCNGLLLSLLLLLLLLLVLLLLGKARFLGGERKDYLWKGWKLCGRNQKHKKITWKKSIRSALCHGEVDERVGWHEVDLS